MALFDNLGVNLEQLSRPPDDSRAVARPPLHYAVQFNRRKAVRALIESGVDTWQQDSQGNTALHTACRTNARGAFDELMSHFRGQLSDLIDDVDSLRSKRTRVIRIDMTTDTESEEDQIEAQIAEKKTKVSQMKDRFKVLNSNGNAVAHECALNRNNDLLRILE